MVVKCSRDKTGIATISFQALSTAMFLGTLVDLGYDLGPGYVMGIDRKSRYQSRMDVAGVSLMLPTGFTNKIYIRLTP
jgi:hypothetical protein